MPSAESGYWLQALFLWACVNRCRKPPTNHLRMYEHYGSDGIDREISTILSQLYKLCFYWGYSGLPHFVLSLEQIEVVRVRAIAPGGDSSSEAVWP